MDSLYGSSDGEYSETLDDDVEMRESIGAISDGTYSETVDNIQISSLTQSINETSSVPVRGLDIEWRL